MSVRSSFTRLLRANLSVLTLQPAERLQFPENLGAIVLHSVGLTALVLYFHFSWVAIVPLLAALVIFQLLFSNGVLAPLFFAYAVLLMRLVFLRILHGSVGGYFDYLMPEWGLALVHVEAATVGAGIYVLLTAAAFVLKSRRRATWVVAFALLLGTVTWAGIEYFGHRTRGTTGSDPYDYVQMGIDLATRGSAVHRFDLFPVVAPLRIAWYPIVHVGYHLPMNERGDAVTVFPIGGAFAYAVADRVFGEEGLYWVNPLFSLISALVAGLLAWELCIRTGPLFRMMVAAFSCALVATSYQQVVWAGVTMVDAQAEFFSALSLFLVLRTRQRKSTWLLLLVGASLGAAYWVRHTQLVLAVSLLLLIWLGNDQPRYRMKAILVTGGAALVLGIGDLWYHQTYLGGWLRPESEELALFSMSVIAESANSLFQQAFAANEFGWLAPFLICGVVQFARRFRVECAALFVWLALSLAFHVPYAAVRLRDLLPEFPVLAFFVSFGLCILAKQVLTGRRGHFVAGIVLFAALELLLLRVRNTAPLALMSGQPIFGYMTQSQRAAFDHLAAITPADAVIGSTLNDGAIDLYSRRATFRPDVWTSAERREFLSVIRASRSSIYLIEDGASMDVVLDDLRRDMQVRRITRLDVPLFGDGPTREPGALWIIEP